MDRHKIDIVFLLIIIACLFFAFIGTFISYNKVINDNVFLGKHYFEHEKELIDICKIDYNEYMTLQRKQFVDSLPNIFGGQDYVNKNLDFLFDVN